MPQSFRRRWIWLVLLALFGCGPNGINSGDRVLVAKCLYETGIKQPERFDVVVFKFPSGPVKNNVPTNYIKRLMGLPGEIIAVFFGQLFRITPPPGESIPGLPENVKPKDLWKAESQPRGAEFQHKINEWFASKKFEIIRKPPVVQMAMRRIVNDNNFQPADLKNFPSRWQPSPDSGWVMSGDRKTFSYKAQSQAEVDWLRYQHLVRPEGGGVIAGNTKLRAQLITDTMGYNDFNLHGFNRDRHPVNWAGDLMLEVSVNVTEPKGEFFLELNKGVNRFQARFDLATGKCTLSRIPEIGPTEELGAADTPLTTGTHSIRFANFDSRLTLWVGNALPFGDGAAYDPPEFGGKDFYGPRKNDLEKPASIGVKCAGVQISDLRVWRDTYYTMSASNADVRLSGDALWSPSNWQEFAEVSPAAFYIYPGHYLCLGDNSTHSSDSRAWGLVPERLMLGRALMVYFPLDRAGLIR
jgi:signal peptidase I